jgi:hypothetical protein
VPDGIRVPGLAGRDEGGQRAFVGALLLGILDEGPLGDEQRQQDEDRAERSDLRGDPEDDEEQTDDAVAHLGQARGRQHRQEHRLEGLAAVDPNDHRDAGEVDQAEDQARHEKRTPHPDHQLPRTGDCREVGGATGEQIGEPTNRTEDGTHRGVEQTSPPARSPAFEQDRRGHHQGAAHRAYEDAGGERDDPTGCHRDPLDHPHPHDASA